MVEFVTPQQVLIINVLVETLHCRYNERAYGTGAACAAAAVKPLHFPVKIPTIVTMQNNNNAEATSDP